MENNNKSDSLDLQSESLKFSLLPLQKMSHPAFDFLSIPDNISKNPSLNINFERFSEQQETLHDFITMDQKAKVQRKLTCHPPKPRFSHTILTHKSLDINRESEKSVKIHGVFGNTDQFVHEIMDEKSNKILTINEEMDENAYDPYKVPVDLDMLDLHTKANKFGLYLPENGKDLIKKQTEGQEVIKTYDFQEERKVYDENKSNMIKEIINDLLDKVIKENQNNGSHSNMASFIKKNEKNKECPCCGEFLEKKPANLCVNSQDLEFLGYSYPLFIKIAKSLIYFVAIPFFFLIFIPHLVFLYNECTSDNVEIQIKVSSLCFCDTGDTGIDLLVFYAIIDDRILLDLLFSIYLSIFAVGLRVYCLRYIATQKQKNSIRHHTILIKNLPKNVNENQIKEFFEGLKLETKRKCCFKKAENSEAIKKFTQIPHEINFIYDLSDYLRISNYIVAMINSRRKCLSLLLFQSKNCPFKATLDEKSWLDLHQKHPFCTCIPHLTLAQLKLIDNKIITYHAKKTEIFLHLQQNPSEFFEKRFCGRAFVNFEDDVFVDELISIYDNIFSLCDSRRKKFQGTRISIERAPVPEEILWENFDATFKQKMGLRMLILFCELLVLVLSAFLIWDIYHKLESSHFEIEFLVGLIILSINRVLTWIIKKLVSYEKHKSTATNEKMMIIVSFTFIIVNIVLYEMLDYIKMMLNIEELNFDIDDYIDGNVELEDFHKTIHKILFVSIFLSIIEPILKFLFDYRFFMKLYKRRSILKNPHLYCQKEAHEAFLGVEFELAEYFSDFILVFLLGILGAPFYPLSFLIVFAGLIVQFWLFKINLLYRCKVEGELCRELMPIFLRILNLCPVFYIAGAYLNAQKLVEGQYRSQYDMQSYFIVFLVEACLVVLLSCLNLEKMVKRRKNKKEKKEFEELIRGKSERSYNQLKLIFKHQK